MTASSCVRGRPAPGAPTPFDGQARDFERRVGLPEEDCRAIAEAVLASAAMQPGGALLEIGAGTGMIGRWFPHAGRIRYLGLDLSRGMLDEFRHRPRAGSAWLAQADASRPWPLPDRSLGAVFSSRAIHLLPLDHVASELFRVLEPGAACVLGWVERRPESIKARMSREMQRRLRERGFAPRSAGGKRLIAACVERGGVEIPHAAVVRWPAQQTPRQSLTHWASKEGLGGIVLPPGVQEEVLRELAAWAALEFGGLDRSEATEEAYVLEGVRLAGG
jgi:SAM-dependent methyltransferase